MADQFREFDDRLRKIDRQHRRLAHGYTATIGRDGLLVAVPRRRRVRVPLLGLTLIALGFIAFKGLAYNHLGASAYESRVAGLAQGTTTERIGAWVMQADPLTQWFAAQAASLMN
jgi:hypothetical protein